MCRGLWGGEKLFRYGGLDSLSGEILVSEDPLEVEAETQQRFADLKYHVIYKVLALLQTTCHYYLWLL